MIMERLLDAVPSQIMATDRQERIVHANRQWLNLFGNGRDLVDVAGRPWSDFFPEVVHGPSLRRNREVIQTRRSRDFDLTISSGGRVRIFLVHKFPLFDGDEIMGVGTIFTDITSRRREAARAAAERNRSERLEAVGELASGVAHDFNNLLGIIDMNVNFARRDCGVTEKFTEDLTAIETAAKSGSELVESLLTFSRRQPGKKERVVVRDVAHEMTEMFGRLLHSNIKIRTVHDDGGPWYILADRSQLERTFVNLVVNARDAMPDGGRLTICTSKQMDEGMRFVRMSFSDTGEGMTEKVRARVFEPFFTTKPRGKGSGLGLATVYGIVRDIGGRVEVESEFGRGTTFILWFPAFDPVELEHLSSL